ncbi:hypothetical protein IEQ34_007662 [Dendrobium chrysotoxum]|uniref:Uncharacterized protein n=1 Tax=Dendrobium chrysotoxum TaxID=161865 RepID=A0AAV7GMM2_DENCH|nr:hypothetical protein IEQ34_007662 [Dendrobium chrysotoxum]
MVQDKGKVFRAKAKECINLFSNEGLHDFYVRESIQHLKRLIKVSLSVEHFESSIWLFDPNLTHDPKLAPLHMTGSLIDIDELIDIVH